LRTNFAQCVETFGRLADVPVADLDGCQSDSRANVVRIFLDCEFQFLPRKIEQALL